MSLHTTYALDSTRTPTKAALDGAQPSSFSQSMEPLRLCERGSCIRRSWRVGLCFGGGCAADSLIQAWDWPKGDPRQKDPAAEGRQGYGQRALKQGLPKAPSRGNPYVCSGNGSQMGALQNPLRRQYLPGLCNWLRVHENREQTGTSVGLGRTKQAINAQPLWCAFLANSRWGGDVFRKARACQGPNRCCVAGSVAVRVTLLSDHHRQSM